MPDYASALYDAFIALVALVIALGGVAAWSEDYYRSVQQRPHGPDDDPAALARIGRQATSRPPDTDAT